MSAQPSSSGTGSMARATANGNTNGNIPMPMPPQHRTGDTQLGGGSNVQGGNMSQQNLNSIVRNCDLISLTSSNLSFRLNVEFIPLLLTSSLTGAVITESPSSFVDARFERGVHLRCRGPSGRRAQEPRQLESTHEDPVIPKKLK